MRQIKKIVYGRNNYGIPIAIKDSLPFSNSTNQTTNPVVALRKSIDIGAGFSKNISMILSVSNSKVEAINNLKKYLNEESIERIIKISKAKSEAKTQYMGISGKDVDLYQKILSRCITNCQKYSQQIIDTTKTYEKEKIWKYGISGDNQIILLTINSISELDNVETLIKAIEYYDMLGYAVDLIIVDTEEESYENYVKESIIDIISNHKHFNSSSSCKICVLNNLNEDELGYLKVRSNIMFDGNNGKIEYQLEEIDYAYKRKSKYYKTIEERPKCYEFNNDSKEIVSCEELIQYNEYGGFSKEKDKYIIVSNKNKKTPVVWSNVLANKNFGTVITESMGGYTWYKNARLNRITTFSNDPIEDLPSESIYLKDCENCKVSGAGISLAKDYSSYKTTHGFGYSIFCHQGIDINQQVEVFVPVENSSKVYLIHLKNMLPKKRKIQLFYTANLSMGEDESESDGYINLDYYRSSNMILLKNVASSSFKGLVYITSTEKIDTFTGNKDEFLGSGAIDNPQGIMLEKLSNSNTLNNSNMVVISIITELETLETKDLAIVLGCEENIIDCKNMAYQYSRIDRCFKELEDVKRYWSCNNEKIKIETPDDEINTLINGWAIYQTLSSRINARSGFYQSGGAYGFRDQLQDSLCLKYVDPVYEKNQIIKHASRQFIEGDVMHWWHEETKRGIRTRFSDDYLWLVYVTLDYIDYSGDEAILDIEIPYLKGDNLEDGQMEKYDLYEESDINESLFKHCYRAVKRACDFGKHGLSKIGSGDWNDGFNNLGTKGKGESVWLSFFLYDILVRFSSLCERKNKIDDATEFKEISERLKKDLNVSAWDGRWYKRAFSDKGEEIGSIHSQECKIDSIAQSWSVISGAGDNDKKYIAMQSLENHLIDKENGIIKLLDPPFENSSINPGYIKSYLPGTRENGGQYTHAAIWVIIAEAMLGFGDKAVQYLKMISPIEHSKTKILADKYKVEPYVIPADIYGEGNLAGVGGWTWYTGSSSWYYICVVKYILGINISKGMLSIKPCIPSDWKTFKVRYKYGRSIYNINVINEGKENQNIMLNGNFQESNYIELKDDGSVNEVNVII